MKKEALNIIKIGGNIVENDVLLNDFVVALKEVEGKCIVVHGGGKKATAMAESQGIESRMVNGRRITSKPMLDVAVMVYAGLINKNLVAKLQQSSISALGLTGADMNSILATKREHAEIDFGYVGDIKKVNVKALDVLLLAGVVPVLAPITHDGQGNLLNTNADNIASAVAIAMSEKYYTKLLLCFELPGVFTDIHQAETLISEMKAERFKELANAGAVNGGMLPKLENGFKALAKGVGEIRITDIYHFKGGGTLLKQR
ncbi:MAG: acetylglutamate kinase [Flavobacteriales bacterium]